MVQQQETTQMLCDTSSKCLSGSGTNHVICNVWVTESGREQSGACKTNTGQHNLPRRSWKLSSRWHMLPSGWTLGLLSIACS